VTTSASTLHLVPHAGIIARLQDYQWVGKDMPVGKQVLITFPHMGYAMLIRKGFHSAFYGRYDATGTSLVLLAIKTNAFAVLEARHY
jgi:hypothetical protein